jgi:hypothetical protein
MTIQPAGINTAQSTAPCLRILVPMVIGKNHLRGNAIGAMVDDECGEDNLGSLRAALRQEARLADVEPTAVWLANSVSAVLEMYEDAHRDWLAAKSTDESIGHVFEVALPSGTSVVLGDRRALARIANIKSPATMSRDQAESIVAAVETARDNIEYSSAYTACKAARIPVEEYQNARMMVYGPNASV